MSSLPALLNPHVPYLSLLSWARFQNLQPASKRARAAQTTHAHRYVAGPSRKTTHAWFLALMALCRWQRRAWDFSISIGVTSSRSSIRGRNCGRIVAGRHQFVQNLSRLQGRVRKLTTLNSTAHSKLAKEPWCHRDRPLRKRTASPSDGKGKLLAMGGQIPATPLSRPPAVEDEGDNQLDDIPRNSNRAATYIVI